MTSGMESIRRNATPRTRMPFLARRSFAASILALQPASSGWDFPSTQTWDADLEQSVHAAFGEGDVTTSRQSPVPQEWSGRSVPDDGRWSCACVPSRRAVPPRAGRRNPARISNIPSWRRQRPARLRWGRRACGSGHRLCLSVSSRCRARRQSPPARERIGPESPSLRVA